MRAVMLAIVCFAFKSLQAQASYTLDIEQGFLFLHSQDVAPIGQSYPTAFNLSYNSWLLDSNHWESCHCFPRVGLSTGFHYYDNPSVLGWGIPLQGFLEPWYKLSDDWFLQIRAGLGLIYLSEPYDELSNPLNLSYSLPVSAYVSLGLGVAHVISDQWRVALQASYDHTSNGGIREPNKGLNYPMLSFNIDYSPQAIFFKAGQRNPFLWTEAKQEFRIMGSLAAQAGGTVGEGSEEQDVTYLVSGLAFWFSQQVGRSSALFAGAEWINNLAYRRQIEDLGLASDHNQFALLFGHEFLLGKFVFSQAAGVYLYKEYGAEASWYQRYLLLYYPYENFGFGPGLKAHAQVAEYLDFRIVWDIPLRTH